MHEELILAGFGGQGVMVAGKLIAYAAMEEGYNVTYIPSYGAEVRGGTANCTVIISEEEIPSPVATSPTMLIVMNEPSYRKFVPRLREDGVLFYNASLIKNPPEDVKVRGDIVPIAANELALEIGDVRVANMVMVGAAAKRMGQIPLEQFKEALKEVIPSYRANLIPLNEKAIDAGFNLL